MLSRSANSIYWMSRYLERADNVARFIDVNSNLILEIERKEVQWEPLIRASGDEDDFYKRYKNPDEQNVIKFLTFDKKNPNSIISCIEYARENARTVQEIISSEVWESINSLYHIVQKNGKKRKIDDLQEFFLTIHKANYFFAGLIENTMSHNEAWLFSKIGRMIERADKTARILDVKYFSLLPSADYFDSPYDSLEWAAVLKSVSGFEIYQKNSYKISYQNVASFLIFNPDFPRSIKFCIDEILDALHKIEKILEIKTITNKEIIKLKNSIQNTNIEDILNKGLHEFVDVLQFNLNIVDASLFDQFFSLEKN